MKNWAKTTLSAITLLMATGLGQAHAAGFADAFRAFVLEDEIATDTTQNTVSLPSDSQSAACMQCHNGSGGKAVALKHADTAMSFTSSGSANHPVGMFYSQYASKQPHSYVNPSRLDARIQLENGQVTCTSCHGVKRPVATITTADLLSAVDDLSSAGASCTSTKTLTTGPNTSSLCMSCHAM